MWIFIGVFVLPNLGKGRLRKNFVQENHNSKTTALLKVCPRAHLALGQRFRLLIGFAAFLSSKIHLEFGSTPVLPVKVKT